MLKNRLVGFQKNISVENELCIHLDMDEVMFYFASKKARKVKFKKKCVLFYVFLLSVKKYNYLTQTSRYLLVYK